MRQVFFIFFIAVILFSLQVNAQHTDTLIVKPQSDSILEKTDNQYSGKKLTQAQSDSIEKKFDNPKRATIYSAILPGAGQVYNKKYWKVPIVYAAIGIPAYAYFYNKSWYQKCQYALVVTINIPITGSTPDSIAAVAPA